MHKKSALLPILLLMLVLLFACGKQPDSSGLEAVMVYPGTVWGMTPGEVCEALKLREGGYSMESMEYGGPMSPASQYLILQEQKVFGEKGRVIFTFLDFRNDGNYCLDSVRVMYPDKADMDAVKRRIQKQFGDPVQVPGWSDEQRAHIVRWESTEKKTEAVPEITYPDDYREALEQEALARVQWSDKAGLLYMGSETGWEHEKNTVYFESAYGYLVNAK